MDKNLLFFIILLILPISFAYPNGSLSGYGYVSPSNKHAQNATVYLWEYHTSNLIDTTNTDEFGFYKFYELPTNISYDVNGTKLPIYTTSTKAENIFVPAGGETTYNSFILYPIFNLIWHSPTQNPKIQELVGTPFYIWADLYSYLEPGNNFTDLKVTMSATNLIILNNSQNTNNESVYLNFTGGVTGEDLEWAWWYVNSTSNFTNNNLIITAGDINDYLIISRIINISYLNLILNSPVNGASYPAGTTSISLNWTVQSDKPIVIDLVYFDNSTGFTLIYSEVHSPGTYTYPIATKDGRTYFWYINSSITDYSVQSEIRNFTIGYDEPTIDSVNYDPIPIRPGDDFIINAYVSGYSNPIDKVWARIWKGATTIWQGFLNFVSGNLWSVTIPTNESFIGNMNITIYANDTAGYNATEFNDYLTAIPYVQLISPSHNYYITCNTTSLTLSFRTADEENTANLLYLNGNIILNETKEPGITNHLINPQDYFICGSLNSWFVTSTNSNGIRVSEIWDIIFVDRNISATLISPTNNQELSPTTNYVDLIWGCYDTESSLPLTQSVFMLTPSEVLVYSENLTPGQNSISFAVQKDTIYRWYVSCYDGYTTTYSQIWQFRVKSENPIKECINDTWGICSLLRGLSIGMNNIFHYWYYSLTILLLLLAIIGGLIALFGAIAKVIMRTIK